MKTKTLTYWLILCLLPILSGCDNGEDIIWDFNTRSIMLKVVNASGQNMLDESTANGWKAEDISATYKDENYHCRRSALRAKFRNPNSRYAGLYARLAHIHREAEPYSVLRRLHAYKLLPEHTDYLPLARRHYHYHHFRLLHYLEIEKRSGSSIQMLPERKRTHSGQRRNHHSEITLQHKRRRSQQERLRYLVVP